MSAKRVVVVVLVAVMVLLSVNLAPAQAQPLNPMPGVWYAVRPGDTAYSIAVRFNTTVWVIAQANGLMNPSLIYSGQVLFIPAAFPGPAPAPLPRPVVYLGPVVHVVRWGETLSSISVMYGVSTWSIACANGLPNPNYIFAGQLLRIPAPMPLARPVMNPYPTWGSPVYPVPVPYAGYSGSPVAY